MQSGVRSALRFIILEKDIYVKFSFLSHSLRHICRLIFRLRSIRGFSCAFLFLPFLNQIPAPGRRPPAAGPPPPLRSFVPASCIPPTPQTMRQGQGVCLFGRHKKIPPGCECIQTGWRDRPQRAAGRAYFKYRSTARATMPPSRPLTRNSATPCTPTSSATKTRGLAAPLAATRPWT